MTDNTKKDASSTDAARPTDRAPSGLALMRRPFPANAISKLPKPTAKQTEAVRANVSAGIRCGVCGGWHHPKVVHLDYVGHAALTDRLLDCDPEWNWEPVATGANGLPVLDASGGMWIYLTVCGVTRRGYGHSDMRHPGDAMKEVIGDALRNAAMRFGAALDLWHKGTLHPDADGDEAKEEQAATPPEKYTRIADAMIAAIKTHGAANVQADKAFKVDFADLEINDPESAQRVKEAIRQNAAPTSDENATPTDNADLSGDKIPY